ncbi:MAG TPA: hypothetical protein RMH99_16915 [Sandaracinaceae bacterium LLY-WYZ-13_1]|nr:hypothetical protein [Sandaracinaceae bacterium LLY-WYZ-13_1]
MRGLAVLLLLLSLPAPTCAQRAGPQACGQAADSADYGEIRVGSEVVLQRHRFVGGDPNWDESMARYLGRVARVTRLSGVDDQGCPGVRVHVDGGRWFWRVRDVNVGADRPRPPPDEGSGAPGAAIPQACGRTEATVDYGPLRTGTVVVLGRHRPVDDDDNWSPPMSAFVGRTGRIVELAGVDERGCPGVHVDADGRQWFWRIRDLSLADDADGTVAYRPGLASDHGRPGPAAAPEVEVDPRMIQACGLTDETASYGDVAPGTAVVLGRHRPVEGVPNWVEEMEAYVGRTARVTELVGVDEQGCPLVRVDVDDGDWFWRLRDLRLP